MTRRPSRLRRLAYFLLAFTFCFSLDAMGQDDTVEDEDLSPGIQLRIESCGYRSPARNIIDDDDSAGDDDDAADDDDSAPADDDDAADDDDSAPADDDDSADDDDAAGADPVAAITAPADNTTVAANTDVTFIGTGDDEEDGSLSGAQLEWSSDVDGVIGTGSPLTAQLSTVGAHVITLTVTDDDGQMGTATINVTVQ